MTPVPRRVAAGEGERQVTHGVCGLGEGREAGMESLPGRGCSHRQELVAQQAQVPLP